ncbi:hypothetical protein BUALT_Bualt16G0066300 [Buddleja alternifolia]|uniref:Odorant receptor n=1 Tax=Buddleja alternifolia TaxID=168488 RepID=A0AAV6WB57_9LAMI|nr:hypothetical protein BUALT_Bualt16G0066300 [Buddleja alternifolia]
MSQYRGNSSGAFRKLLQPSFNRRPPQAEHHQRPLKNVVWRSSSSTNPSIGSIGGGLERFSKNPYDSFVDMEPQIFHSLVDEMDVDGEEQWENMRKWVVACVVAYATHVIFLVSLIRGPNYVDELTSIEGDYERQTTRWERMSCRDQEELQILSVLQGAIDGSHFRVKVLSSDAPRYRGRKSDPTQNVLAACTFDLKFTYVLSVWEGSASDSRSLKDALIDPNITIIREIDEELMNKESETYPSLVDECREGELLRETIANDMGRDYNYEDDQGDFTTVHDKKNLKWSDEMDKCLVDALMEQKIKGQKIGGVFTSTAYKAAATNVSSKFQFSCDSTHAKPAASHFRYTPVPNYENLDEIFGKDRATGNRAAGVKQRRLEWAREQNSIEEHGEDEWSDERDKYDNNEESSTSKALTSSKKTSDDSKKKKMRMIDIVREEISMLTASMGEVAIAINLGNQRNYNEEKLFDEIASVGGMTEISQMTVYQKLTGAVSVARAFHKCPTEQKRLWVLVKFGQEIFDHPSN